MKRRAWTAADLKTLRESYPLTSNADLAKSFRRSTTSISQKAQVLGLKKADDRFQAATRFGKGLVPWNTGMKGWQAGGRFKETQFKKGSLVWNRKPVGTERTNSEGYIEIKLAEPNVWELKQRAIWKSIHGELSAGDYVRFVDGDRQNFSPDNLRLIARQENMSLNSIHRLPSEVKDVIRLQAKLSKQIERAHEK